MAKKKTVRRKANGNAKPKAPRNKQAAQHDLAAAIPPPADALIVYIHGIGRHKPAADLKVDWDIALFGSDQGAATRMAYWSDIVHPAAAGAKGKKAKAGDDDSGDLVKDALAESGVAATKAAMNYGAAVAAQLGAPAEHYRGPGKKVLPLPGFLRRPIAEAVLKRFIGDSAAYFFDKDKRSKIRARFMAELPNDPNQPVTVVAHSQGSVAALEVLAELGKKVKVVKFVTIGSPLGLQEVQDLLDVSPKKKPFHVPAGIEQWQNFADPLDPVALDKELRGEFMRPKPDPSEPLESFVTDALVINDGTRRLAGFNPHSAIGYLAHPKVRRAVYDAAQRDVMARFVVARDVAEGLSVQQRHPLMIELLEPGYWALNETSKERDEREAKEAGTDDSITLASRVEGAAKDLELLVRDTAKASGLNASEAVAAARIDPLRRFVAARLTPDEIRQVAVESSRVQRVRGVEELVEAQADLTVTSSPAGRRGS